jgi:hypothetical protein
MGFDNKPTVIVESIRDRKDCLHVLIRQQHSTAATWLLRMQTGSPQRRVVSLM